MHALARRNKRHLARVSVGEEDVVHVAENGHTFELHCEAMISVESVWCRLESLASLPIDDQLPMDFAMFKRWTNNKG